MYNSICGAARESFRHSGAHRVCKVEVMVGNELPMGKVSGTYVSQCMGGAPRTSCEVKSLELRKRRQACESTETTP